MANNPSPMRDRAYSRELAELIVSRVGPLSDGVGVQLPNERALAAELGVTRTMIRHALASLEAEGRISREVGRGTFLRPLPAKRGSAAGPEAVGPADVMAARRVIEPGVLKLVVAWATQHDFDEMKRCVEGGAAAESAAEFETWDYALHHAIVAAGRNELLLAMYAVIEGARHGEIWGNLKRRNDSRERRAIYQADHVELVEALCARELAHAEAVMDAHLARVQANLLDAESTPLASA